MWMCGGCVCVVCGVDDEVCVVQILISRLNPFVKTFFFCLFFFFLFLIF